MVRLALIGGGRIGAVHFKNMISSPFAHCSHVIAATKKESQSLIHENGQQSVTTACAPNDLESVLSEVDGVIVACSTPYHYDYIHQSLTAQKPVFTEKPVCATLTEIEELFEHASAMNMNGIFVGFQRRFDPTIQKIYDEIHNNEYFLCKDKNQAHFINDYLSNESGIEKIISISRDPTYPPLEYLASSGSAFYDAVVHDVDIICHLTKEYPTKVYCSASATFAPIKDLNDYDRMFINLEFESGVLGMIDWCRHSGFGYDQQLKVLGYNGQLSMINQPVHNLMKCDHKRVISANPMDYFVDRYQEAYRNELNEFIKTVNDPNVEIHSTYEQIQNVQLVLDAAKESAELGRAVDIYYGGENMKTISHSSIMH